MAQESNGYISRSSMTTVLVAAGLVMSAFGAFITMQNNSTGGRIDTVDKRIDAERIDMKTIQDKLEANYLRKDEHQEFKYRLDRDIALIRDEQQRRATQIVPRTEHEARWSAYDANEKLMAERLNEVRNLASANSTVPLRDEMTRVQQEISDLRKLLVDRTTS